MRTFHLAGGCFWCLDAVYRLLDGAHDVFFTLHDPRRLSRQGDDIGTRYRSAMLFANDEQKELLEAARDRASDYWNGGIVTEIAPLSTYCIAVALPKLTTIRQSYSSSITAS